MPFIELRKNEASQTPLLSAEIANTPLRRAIGLLGRASLSRGAGLWLQPCNGVHTLGMRFSIDVVYFDAKGTALRVCVNVSPWRLCLPVRGACAMLELCAGDAQRLGIEEGKTYILQRPPDLENH